MSILSRARHPRAGIARMVQRTRNARGDVADRSVLDDLYVQNGFLVRRGLLDADECKALADRLTIDVQREASRRGMPKIANFADPTQRSELMRRIVRHPKVLGFAREALGPDVCFLQVADLQSGFMRGNWHRDTPDRQLGVGPDYDEREYPYGVAKVYVALDVDHFALCVTPGSHRPGLGSVGKQPDVEENYRFVRAGETIDEPVVATAGVDVRRTAIELGNGDALLFDQRLLHRGQPLTPDGRWADKVTGRKVVAAMVYGLDNVHSRRFYSYFRYMRANYAAMRPRFVRDLQREGLLLSAGEANLFDEAPEQARHAFIPKS
jgi:hypothetical protein